MEKYNQIENNNDIVPIQSTKEIEFIKQGVVPDLAPKKKPRIADIKEAQYLDEYPLDNTYLLKGYRQGHFNFKDCLKSLFHWHNETQNIWTHQIGSIFFIFLIYWFLFQFDKVGEFYRKMMINLQHFVLHDMTYSINTIMDNLGIFETSLIDLYSKATDSTKSTIASTIKDSQALLKYKNDIIYYASRLPEFLSMENLNIHKLASYQNLMLYFNKKVNELQGIQNTTFLNANSIDFNLVKPWSELGDQLPDSEAYETLTILPLIIYFLSAITCLGCSTTFHWFHPMNKLYFSILHRLDLSGITILIFGSTYTCCFYAFYCNNVLFWIYTTTNFFTCFGTFVVSMCDWFHEEKYVKVKGIVYASCGLFAGATSIIVAIQSLKSGPDSDYIPFFIPLLWMLAMGASYLGGLVFYVYRIPERWFPQCSNFNSHVIWHCFVFMAACCHVFVVVGLYEARFKCKCLYERVNF